MAISPVSSIGDMLVNMALGTSSSGKTSAVQSAGKVNPVAKASPPMTNMESPPQRPSEAGKGSKIDICC